MLTGINPLAHGLLEYYWLSPLLVLAALVLGAWQLCRALLNPPHRAPATALLLMLVLVQLPSPAEGLYWLTGAWAYLLSGAIALSWGAQLVRAAQTRSPLHFVAAGMLTVVLMGTNFVTAALLAGLLLLLVLRSKAGQRAPWLVLTALALVCLGVAVAAPGNVHRLATVQAPQLGLGRQVVLAVCKAGVAATYSLLNWFGNGLLLAVTLLLVPAMGRLALQPTLALQRLTRSPWLLSAVTLGLVLAAFLPTYLTVQLPPPPRLRNVIYLLFVVGWLLSAYAWVAWWVQQGHVLPPLPAYVRLALLGWLPLALATDHNTHLTHAGIGQGYTAVVQAYRDWLSGDAARYDAAQRARYATLRATAAPGVGLPPLPVQPVTLFYYDISANSTLWGNQAYAQFFGKKAVWVQPPSAKP
ncbi:hypothetical protein GCM10022409_25270 [Hymenobacter glaciei]|uniref:Uncharacterized protein n=1 Tax=Hymenobacter glaciei TaxID=877209 RepID=A0ABP7U9T4_9BACT